MAAAIASRGFAATSLVRRPTTHTHTRRSTPRNVVRSALETQRYATPYDGYK